MIARESSENEPLISDIFAINYNNPRRNFGRCGERTAAEGNGRQYGERGDIEKRVISRVNVQLYIMDRTKDRRGKIIKIMMREKFKRKVSRNKLTRNVSLYCSQHTHDPR